MAKILAFIHLLACLIWTSCSSTTSKTANNQNDSAITTRGDTIVKEPSVPIDRATALKIAEKNARTAYRDLSIYDIKAELKDGKWYVDYNLSDPHSLGGGPHYIISAATGKIDSCRYEQ